MRRQEMVSERALRTELIKKLEGLSTKEARSFLQEFDQLKLKDEREDLLKRLIDRISGAQKSDHWGNGDKVHIGEFGKNRGTFNTLLIHEAVHGVLDELLGKKRDFGGHTEEELCYRVARSICKTTRLPYNSRIEKVGLGFSRAVNCEDPEAEIDKLMSYPEARILGFSSRQRTR